jgi:hypothetical protein
LILGLLYRLAIISLLAARATQWALAKRDEVRVQIGDTNMTLLTEFIAFAVKAAEQLALTKRIQDVAEEKLRWVTDAVRRFAAERGIAFNPDEVLVLIEGAIRDGVHKGTGLLEISYSDEDDDDVGTLPPRGLR